GTSTSPGAPRSSHGTVSAGSARAPSSGTAVQAARAISTGCPRCPSYVAATSSAPLSRQTSITRSTAAGTRSGPSASATTAASTPSASAASPQRRLAPGPRSQSGQRTSGAAASSGCAPVTTTIPSTDERPSASTTSWTSRACFGPPKRVAAPAARTTPATTALLLDGDLADHDILGRLLARVAELADALDDVEAVHDLADDCVVRR